MRKHTSSCEYNQIDLNYSIEQKLQKVETPRNKGRNYKFSHSFRTINTPNIRALCLHATEPLIAISSDIYRNHSVNQSFVSIYTLDGDLITTFEGSSVKTSIYLSSTMMITSFSGRTLTRYNDYSVKDSLSEFSCFTCDMNDNIYTLPIQSWEIVDGDGISSVDIYSPDLEYVKPFKLQSCLYICSIRILEDTMAILSKKSLPFPHYYAISWYSLSKEELLKTVQLKDERLFGHMPDLTISFDPLGNIFINGYRRSQLAVCYVDDGILCHLYDSRVYEGKAIGVEMTESFQLVRAFWESVRICDDEADIFE